MFILVPLFMFLVMILFVVVLFIGMLNSAFGNIKIAITAIFETVGHIQAADVTAVRKRTGVTVVNRLRFSTNPHRAFGQICARNGVVDDIDDAARCATCVKQRGWTFGDFDLGNIRKIHLIKVVCANA